MLAVNMTDRFRSMRPTRASNGFTLIELLVIIALIGVLASLAAPNVREIAANQALRNASADLMASTMNARSAAIKRGSRVLIQPQSGSNWASGWVIYFDINRNDSFDSGTDELIDTLDALSSYVTAPTTASTACTGANTTPRALFAYEGTGFLVGATNGYVRFEAPLTARKRCMVVNLPGRAKLCEPGSPGSPC
jgi:type IV fimbrial biogenesis protein FimT